MRSEQEKTPRILNYFFLLFTQRIRCASPINADISSVNTLAQKYLSFILLDIPLYLYLLRHVHLNHHLYLSVYCSQQK
jgi:hypothetical protein